jgi:hypothetical protein
MGQKISLQTIKAKINKLVKTKKFLHSKGNKKQNEKVTYRLGKIFINHITEKGSNIYNELLQLNSRKII